jgi:hypothetical protein
MSLLLAALIAFASGFAIETACVYWVHFSERNRALPTALCSASIAPAQICGIGESIRDWRVGVFYVLGFFVGTYTAVKRKARASDASTRDAS